MVVKRRRPLSRASVGLRNLFVGGVGAVFGVMTHVARVLARVMLHRLAVVHGLGAFRRVGHGT